MEQEGVWSGWETTCESSENSNYVPFLGVGVGGGEGLCALFCFHGSKFSCVLWLGA